MMGRHCLWNREERDRDPDASSPFNAALQAAALLALKLSSFHDCKAAPAVLQALLGCAGAE
jgi:hypothetical protein